MSHWSSQARLTVCHSHQGGPLASPAQRARTHLQVSNAVHDAADVVGAERTFDAPLRRANYAPRCTLTVTYVHNMS